MLLLAACRQQEPSTAAPEAAPAAAVQAAGLYQGLLPCADCPGIEATLYLYPDSTYEETLLYVGKPASTTFLSEGRWQQVGSDQVRLLRKTGGSPARYLLTRNGLQQLDLSGKPMEGALANRYYLSRLGAL